MQINQQVCTFKLSLSVMQLYVSDTKRGLRGMQRHFTPTFTALWERQLDLWNIELDRRKAQLVERVRAPLAELRETAAAAEQQQQ